MSQERRNHSRIKPKGLRADVQVNRTVENETAIVGEILDISYSGIRIKLTDPLPINVEGKVRITMNLPQSGAPFTVHGTLKHQPVETECGVHYTDHAEGSIDDLMFECIKLTDQTLLIKTS